MKHSFFKFIIACSIISLTAGGCSLMPKSMDAEVNRALKDLDQTLRKQSEISEAKEARIGALRAKIPHISGQDLYNVYDSLFEEYIKWDCDSALAYAHKKETLAKEIGADTLINDGAKDLARRYIISGMYHEAYAVLSLADSLTSHKFPTEPSRIYLFYEVYHGIVLSSSDEIIRRKVNSLEAEYLKLSSATIEETDINYYNIKAKTMIPGGRSSELIPILQNKLIDSSTTMQEKAILYYWLGRAYHSTEDYNNAILNFISSAKCDLESPIREYRSLIIVAKYCQTIGLTSLAYRFIIRAYDDAMISDAKIRIRQIGDTLSEISDEYYHTINRNRLFATVMLVFLFVLFILSATLSFFLIGSRKKVSMANKKITRSNHELKDANRVKDTYIGQFLSMFSNQIDALEQYRSKLRVIAKQRNLDTLVTELHSDDFIDSQWDLLFDKFDSIFLGLFPDFVEKLNALLSPDNQLATPPMGKLTTEIRVFALIRLGITDSSRIAKYLRKSVTTIYNYRVKLRNVALGKRENFEERVKQIGT